MTGWLIDGLGRVLRSASTLGRSLTEVVLEHVFGPPVGLVPPLPPGEHARRAVAAREAVARLDEDEARARGESPTPVARRTTEWAPIEAAVDLAAHTWVDGEMGHTGDLWRADLAVEHLACLDVFELTKIGEAADVYCHKAARHDVRDDLNPTHEGVDQSGRLRRWHYVSATHSDTEVDSAQDGEEGTE
jgi:hypothetical protein